MRDARQLEATLPRVERVAAVARDEHAAARVEAVVDAQLDRDGATDEQHDHRVHPLLPLLEVARDALTGEGHNLLQLGDEPRKRPHPKDEVDGRDLGLALIAQLLGSLLAQNPEENEEAGVRGRWPISLIFGIWKKKRNRTDQCRPPSRSACPRCRGTPAHTRRPTPPSPRRACPQCRPRRPSCPRRGLSCSPPTTPSSSHPRWCAGTCCRRRAATSSPSSLCRAAALSTRWSSWSSLLRRQPQLVVRRHHLTEGPGMKKKNICSTMRHSGVERMHARDVGKSPQKYASAGSVGGGARRTADTAPRVARAPRMRGRGRLDPQQLQAAALSFSNRGSACAVGTSVGSGTASLLSGTASSRPIAQSSYMSAKWSRCSSSARRCGSAERRQRAGR